MKIAFTKEVAAALKKRGPVVALETSVVAQGLPHPQNLHAARACEEIIRRKGAVPAPVAVVDGAIHVGLAEDQMRRLAEGKEPLLKIGSRDLAVAVAGRRSGGTTVSATCEIAAAAGIRIFATGGIGGVHRDAAETFDLSQDLWALSRFPVAVVCAGAKAILDLPKTLELLEAIAVPVFGVGTREFPGFYSRETGLTLEHEVEDHEVGAERMRARFDDLGQGGMLFAVPPPEDTSLPRAEVELHIAEAMRAAAQAHVKGKALTPFLLQELAQRTAGKSLRANLALLANNAQFAAMLAVAYARGGKKAKAAPRRKR